MYKLKDKIIDNCGNKVMFLSMLKAKGYNVASGVVITFEEFKEMVKDQKLDFDTMDKLKITDAIIDEIFNEIPSNKKIAVRSSANIEDESNYTKAGKFNTYLNVAYDRECLKDKIKDCFLSLYSKDNMAYYKRNNIDVGKVEMSIIVQEMIESNVSGILFTVNPTNGKDSQIVIEFSRGYGQVVDGNIVPERLVYDWREQKYLEEPKINLLGESAVRRIINISLTLQQELGFPIDVEFGVYDSKLYIFQIRPITKIEYKDIYYRYSILNSNEDKILSPMMISLDSKVYTDATVSFAQEIKNMTKENILRPVVFSRFSRFYWNLSFLKKIFDDVPGFVERYFDESLKVKIDYLDNGKENIQEKEGRLKIFSRKSLIDELKQKVVNVEEYRKKQLESLDTICAGEDLSEKLSKLFELYFETKKEYITQMFIGDIYKIDLNQKYNKLLTKLEIERLLLGIDNKYENSPYLHMWDTSREVKSDLKKMEFLEYNLDAEIYYSYLKDRDNSNIKYFLTDFIDLYGYNSFDKRDIMSKTYEEEVLKVIKMYRDVLETDSRHDPLSRLKEQNQEYVETLKKLEESMKPSQYKVALKHIEYVREHKKEEYGFEDLVSIVQSKLRKALLELGAKYKEEYLLDDASDIFYLDYNDIENKEIIKQEASKNKIYYNSFRNYLPQTDIFPSAKGQIQMDYRKTLKGIGASFGKVTARVCVVNSKEDLKLFKKSDIIVTKFLDKEIFNSINLSQVSGIVTEFGGILCHFAINAREMRIPCIVGLKDITTSVRTGETIAINGDTGEVII